MVTQKILDQTDQRHRARLASMGYACPPPALCQKTSASATPHRQSTRSEFGLRCLGETYFDANRPRRMLEGKLLSGPGQNANGAAFSAKGMRFNLPLPLMFSHSRPVGRVNAVFAHIDGAITFHAELANTGLDFANSLWQDISDRKIDCASLGGQTLTGVTTGLVTDWNLTEVSIALCGADPGAVLTRVFERLPGEYSTLHAPTREIWAGPVTYWDEVDMGPRESDDPVQPKESAMAVAASLLTQRRAELAALRAHA